MNLLKENIEAIDLSKKLTIDNKTNTYQVYRIPLDLLYYNDQNDRIATWLSQYKDENNIASINKDNIEQYNDIIQKFIIESNPERLKKTQTNIKLVGQREPGVVLKDGRIIDGNRRYTCLRNLQKEGEKQYFEAVIIPLDVENDAKAIKMLELNLQHGEDTKVDYNPIDKLVGIYNDLVVNKLLTTAEYAQGVNKTIAEVEKEKNVALLMVDFLKYINADGKFYIARNFDLNGPLLELQGMVNRTPSEQIEDLKKAVYANFLFKPEGDMTRYIRKLKKIINTDYLSEYLIEQSEMECHIKNVIPKDPRLITDEYINRVIRTNTSITNKLIANLNKAVSKAEKDDAKNRPIKIANDSLSKLQSIDLRILGKLNESQLKELQKVVSDIEKMCESVKECINDLEPKQTESHNMTYDEAVDAIEQLRREGNSDEKIVSILYAMFVDDELDINGLEQLCRIVGYELTDEFKRMSPEEQKTKGYEEENY